MPRIDGSAGPVPVSSSSISSDKSVATVKLGESKLSEVAQRLGVDSDSLHKANPQISEPNQLKVGQELNLPQFQAAQNLKLNDESVLQSQSSQSSLPHPPLGDPLAKKAMQARLSANDLSQVPGGAQQLNSKQLKFADKVHTGDSPIKEDKWSKADGPLEGNKVVDASKAFQKADDLAQVSGGAGHVDLQQMKYADKGMTHRPTNADKWSKADKPLDADKTIGAEKTFQKADDLAQVAGGAGQVDLQQMKEAGKAIHTGQWKDAGKVIDANKAIKMDKSTDPEKASIKLDQGTKGLETTQDVAVNKAKTADKAYTQMDGYIRQ